jgi:hypothetical protein
MNVAFFNRFIYKPGYGYLWQFLPDKQDWPNEFSKWYVIQNPGTRERVDEIADSLTKRGAKYSITLSEQDRLDILEKGEIDVTEFMTLWQKICWKLAKVYWYQDWSGQYAISYKEISFGEHDLNDDGESIIKARTKIKTPYLFSLNFEYGFKVRKQEDAASMKLDMDFSISGECDNPHIFDIDHSDGFKRIYTTVEDKADRVVNENVFHKLHKKLRGIVDNNQVKQIREVFQEEIIDELDNALGYIGFIWNPKSVNVLQVEPADEATKMALEKILEAETVQFDNEILLEKNRAANEVIKETALAKKQAAITESEGQITVEINVATGKGIAKQIEAESIFEALKTIAPAQKALLHARLMAVKGTDANPDLILLGDALGQLNLGGNSINLQNLNVNQFVNDLLSQTKTVSSPQNNAA